MLAGLRVHPVLTAHPTEARRRAVTEALRRIGALLARLNDGRLGASEHAEALRRLRRRSTCSGGRPRCGCRRCSRWTRSARSWPPSTKRCSGVVPALYRSLDRALQGPRIRRRGRGRARVPAVRQLGRRGPGRQPVRDRAGDRETAEIQADHALRALQNAAARVGGALHGVRPSPRWPGRAITGAPRRAPGPSGPAGRDHRAFPRRAAPRLSAVRGAAAAGDPAGRDRAG